MNAETTASKKTTTTPAADVPEMRFVKRGRCPSLSGKSTLAYEIGCNDKSDLHFRIVGNSNPGAYNDDWVSLSLMEKKFDLFCPNGAPVTSDAIAGSFAGKSQNTPGFVFAALKNEGFVRASTQKPRCYDRTEPSAWKELVKQLLRGPDAAAEEPKGKAKKGTEKKRPTVTTKKAKAS